MTAAICIGVSCSLIVNHSDLSFVVESNHDNTNARSSIIIVTNIKLLISVM